MSKFVRLINQSVEDILVIKAKDINHRGDEFQHCSSDALRYSKFNGVSSGLSEKLKSRIILGASSSIFRMVSTCRISKSREFVLEKSAISDIKYMLAINSFFDRNRG